MVSNDNEVDLLENVLPDNVVRYGETILKECERFHTLECSCTVCKER